MPADATEITTPIIQVSIEMWTVFSRRFSKNLRVLQITAIKVMTTFHSFCKFYWEVSDTGLDG